jgi:hypothetical protein
MEPINNTMGNTSNNIRFIGKLLLQLAAYQPKAKRAKYISYIA